MAVKTHPIVDPEGSVAEPSNAWDSSPIKKKGSSASDFSDANTKETEKLNQGSPGNTVRSDKKKKGCCGRVWDFVEDPGSSKPVRSTVVSAAPRVSVSICFIFCFSGGGVVCCGVVTDYGLKLGICVSRRRLGSPSCCLCSSFFLVSLLLRGGAHASSGIWVVNMDYVADFYIYGDFGVGNTPRTLDSSPFRWFQCNSSGNILGYFQRVVLDRNLLYFQLHYGVHAEVFL
mmetsp:Transcript_28614/g.73013  ORF Transcript_28614/g.73013 Transcript_28614/m.73013 type:complete len:230 (+) Transcript_28614:544-1233(+)